MATEYGITTTGFVRKTLSEIRSEIDEALRVTFGEQINTSSESIFGQLRDIFADRESFSWELAELVYNSQYPDTAEGTSLENIGALSALEYIEAAPSTIQNQRFLGTATTTVPAGTQVTVFGDETTVFETDEALTLVAGTDEIQTIGFSNTPDEGGFTVSYEGDETATIAYDEGSAEFQIALRALTHLSEVTVSGTFATDFTVTFTGIDGTQEQPILIEETNTLKASAVSTVITITETVPGINQGIVDMTCTVTGPTSVNARTLTVISNPIAGIDSTINVDDAILGRDVETDAEFRIRRLTRLTTSLSGPVEAIINKLWHLNDDEYSALDQLQNVNVYENVTNVVDSRNMPAKSLMAVVRQVGDVITRDQEIAQFIFDSKPAGIETSFGNDIHTIDFTGSPSSGTWTLDYSGQTTSALAYDISSANLEIAINALSNMSGVSVTGSMGAGFEVEYAGANASVMKEFPTGDISILTGCTAITIIRHVMKVTNTVTDSVGVSHTINFARPIEVEIEAKIALIETDDNYPTDGDDQIKAAIATWGDTLGVGVNIVVVPTLIAQVATVPGITDFVFGIRKKSVGGNYEPDNITISDGTSTHPEFSSWDTSDITVTTGALN